MEQHHLEEIIKTNPNIDASAIARSRQAAKKLSEAGIKLGGYRLTPALSDTAIRHSDGVAWHDSNSPQRVHEDKAF